MVTVLPNALTGDGAGMCQAGQSSCKGDTCQGDSNVEGTADVATAADLATLRADLSSAIG